MNKLELFLNGINSDAYNDLVTEIMDFTSDDREDVIDSIQCEIDDGTSISEMLESGMFFFWGGTRADQVTNQNWGEIWETAKELDRGL